jgi:DNA-binding NarL/FixJ family response regulator
VAEPITCLIVDDHEVVREGLRLALSRTDNIRVIGEASDGSAAVALARRRRPNVVIMDVRMPGVDGLQAAREICAEVPEASVLMFTAYGERSLRRATSSRRLRTRPWCAPSRRWPAATDTSTRRSCPRS